MAGTAPNIKLRKDTYYVRVQVPANVQAVIGKTELWESLRTGNFHDARKAAPPVIDRFKREIDAARRGTWDQTRTMPARAALANWAVKQAARPPTLEGDLYSELNTLQRVAALQRAWNNPEGYRDIEGFDEDLATILSANGCRVTSTDPVIAEMRQEAALTFLYAAQFAERGRLATAFTKRAEAVQQADLETIAVAPSKPGNELPAPSLTISKLFERWFASVRPSDKEAGRLRHQLRRMLEAVGDIPANYLTKDQVADFMSWVVRFPGRKRSAKLNALPLRELVEAFETLNAKLAESGEPTCPTLTKTTVEEWFAGYKRMFSFGVDLDLIDKNPFDRLKALVVNGADSVKRRAFNDDEIALIFSAPLFTGFDPERSTRFREFTGETIVRDARYWLPILSLFHGGRLAEFAAMPLADLRQTAKGTWYFDLTGRAVKTEASKRQIPLHPHMRKIGFLDYVATLWEAGEPWMFPDLDQKSRHGPGHAFSKWWGEWMDKHSLSDPALAHHSWRHTWKRRARASAVKEEMHDVISGHKGLSSVSRTYGEGADIEDLARDMALIEFPAFPEIQAR
jgi:hypothetical protein